MIRGINIAPQSLWRRLQDRLEQIRTIDKQRLQEYLGTLDGRFLLDVDKALAISIGIEKRTNPLVIQYKLHLIHW